MEDFKSVIEMGNRVMAQSFNVFGYDVTFWQIFFFSVIGFAVLYVFFGITR